MEKKTFSVLKMWKEYVLSQGFRYRTHRPNDISSWYAFSDTVTGHEMGEFTLLMVNKEDANMSTGSGWSFEASPKLESVRNRRTAKFAYGYAKRLITESSGTPNVYAGLVPPMDTWKTVDGQFQGDKHQIVEISGKWFAVPIGLESFIGKQIKFKYEPGQYPLILNPQVWYATGALKPTNEALPSHEIFEDIADDIIQTYGLDGDAANKVMNAVMASVGTGSDVESKINAAAQITGKPYDDIKRMFSARGIYAEMKRETVDQNPGAAEKPKKAKKPKPKYVVPTVLQTEIDKSAARGWWDGRNMPAVLEGIEDFGLFVREYNRAKAFCGPDRYVALSTSPRMVTIEVIDIVPYGSDKFEKAQGHVPHFVKIGHATTVNDPERDPVGKTRELTISYCTVADTSEKPFSTFQFDEFIKMNSHKVNESADHDACPVCSERMTSQCKCGGPGFHTMESLKNGHGMRCKNGHRWTYRTADGSALVMEAAQLDPDGKLVGLDMSTDLDVSDADYKRYLTAILAEYGLKPSNGRIIGPNYFEYELPMDAMDALDALGVPYSVDRATNREHPDFGKQYLKFTQMWGKLESVSAKKVYESVDEPTDKDFSRMILNNGSIYYRYFVDFLGKIIKFIKSNPDRFPMINKYGFGNNKPIGMSYDTKGQVTEICIKIYLRYGSWSSDGVKTEDVGAIVEEIKAMGFSVVNTNVDGRVWSGPVAGGTIISGKTIDIVIDGFNKNKSE